MRNQFESFDSGLSIEKAHGQAKEMLDKHAIDIESFSGLYGDDVVSEDLLLVEKLRARYQEEHDRMPREEQHVHMLATIFEAIVHEHGELSDWFGSQANTMRVSDFDDLVNGIDEIIEFEEGEHSATHLALAIDLTTGSTTQKKVDRILTEINEGHLAEIKYFESDHLDMKGQKLNVPRIIIGANQKTVRELMELWLNKNMKELSVHPIAVQLLEEMRIQAEGFATYARNNNQEKIASIYEKTGRIIRRIFAEKDLIPGETLEDLKQDDVFYSLHEHMRRISGEI